MASKPTVAIVGAGFSGTLAAIHLLRGPTPLRVVLIDRSRSAIARGLAYGACRPAHLLNVPAAGMSAFPDDPASFLRFARRRDPSLNRDSFLPRRLYGDYLKNLLANAAAASAASTLERVVNDVIAVKVLQTGERAALTMAGGDKLEAERVLLAQGNHPPANPRILNPDFYGDPRYVRDPWDPALLERVNHPAPVLLIGTGLTMVDVALTLRANGVTAPLHAISRHGLLPTAHRPTSSPVSRDACPPGIETGPATALAYLQSVRRHVKRLATQGVDWREVVGALRPLTPQLWQALSLVERERFLNHLRPYWEIHRHRQPPEVAVATDKLIGTKALTIHAGRIIDLRADPGCVHVVYQPRGTDLRHTLEVGTVINCTGPVGEVRAHVDPLTIDLLRCGHVTADPLGIGVRTASNYALLDALGVPSRVLFYVGPLLRATWWESTAVPELRFHAWQAAQIVAESLGATAREDAPGSSRLAA